MHIAVTGGAGYIGSTLVPLLLESGHRVTVIDRLYFGEASLKRAFEANPDKLKLVRADVRRVDPRTFEGIEGLVDLAGISNDPSCELDTELTRSINLEGALRVARLAQAAGAQRIVFASSCSVYGHGAGLALTEESPLHPVSLYAHCKAEAERGLFALGKSTGVAVTALRFATVFGLSEKMRFDLAVNVMTKNAYVARKITVDGGGQQWRPFVHVRDVAEAIRRAVEAPVGTLKNQVINVGSSANNVRIKNLAYRVRDLVPGTEVVMAPSDPDLRDYNVAFDRAGALLDFCPARSIEDGVVEILSALHAGVVDPDDRRCYTLRQYQFLAEVERTFNDVAMDGRVLV
ncbi:MAG TPA: SDR family oxidoreductase [Polyangiaceae bacterium]|nr:SDR family oxidoreductase [Polyangiaceae bacterium]